MTFSSISLILKKEGFFGSEDGLSDIQKYNLTTHSVCSTVQSSSADHEIGLIMTLSMSLLGLLLLFSGILKGVYILLVDLRILWPNFVPSLIRLRRFQKSYWFGSKPIGSKVTVWSSNLRRARFIAEFRLR